MGPGARLDSESLGRRSDPVGAPATQSMLPLAASAADQKQVELQLGEIEAKPMGRGIEKKKPRDSQPRPDGYGVAGGVVASPWRVDAVAAQPEQLFDLIPTKLRIPGDHQSRNPGSTGTGAGGSAEGVRVVSGGITIALAARIVTAGSRNVGGPDSGRQ